MQGFCRGGNWIPKVLYSAAKKLFIREKSIDWIFAERPIFSGGTGGSGVAMPPPVHKSLDKPKNLFYTAVHCNICIKVIAKSECSGVFSFVLKPQSWRPAWWLSCLDVFAAVQNRTWPEMTEDPIAIHLLKEKNQDLCIKARFYFFFNFKWDMHFTYNSLIGLIIV